MINSYYQALDKVYEGIQGKDSHEASMLIINKYEDVL